MAKDTQANQSAVKKPLLSRSTTSQADIISSIDKLESLVADDLLSASPMELKDGIPVLNDVVDIEEMGRYTAPETDTRVSNIPVLGRNEELPIETINNVLDTLDQRLAKELSSIVNILKDKVRTDIINELKGKLKKETTQTEFPYVEGSISKPAK